MRSPESQPIARLVGDKVLLSSTSQTQTPQRIQKMEPPKITLITTLGKLADYLEVPFFGSFRGSGDSVKIEHACQCVLAPMGNVKCLGRGVRLSRLPTQYGYPFF